MSKGKISSHCDHCEKPTLKSDCFIHCHDNTSGVHEANPRSATQADGSDFVVDYTCKHCGQSGSVAVPEADITWG